MVLKYGQPVIHVSSRFSVREAIIKAAKTQAVCFLPLFALCILCVMRVCVCVCVRVCTCGCVSVAVIFRDGGNQLY